MVSIDIERKFDVVCSKLLASVDLPDRLLKDGDNHLKWVAKSTLGSDPDLSAWREILVMSISPNMEWP